MNVLITNYFIRNFTGSEINALQLCLALRNFGIKADVATFFYDQPLKRVFEDHQIRVKNLLDENLELGEYDLFWTHHIHTINHLLFHFEPHPAKFIYSCLGPFSPLAVPPYYHSELNFILSNSEGNTSILLEEGLAEEKIHFFPNFAPKEFFEQHRTQPSTKPQKIGVISNHPPDEINNFSRIAMEQGYQVEFIGFKGQQVLVTPELLKQFDVAISIGKTVQYCFALKTPIYCYDHFGGPGFIDQNNIQTSQYYNFSGRGIDRKLSGYEIFEEITGLYQKARSNLDFLFDYAKEHFMLEKNIEVLLKKLSEHEKIDLSKVRQKYALTKRHHLDFLEKLKYQIRLEEEISGRSRGALHTISRHQEIADLEQEILSYTLSTSWRLTRPFRKLMNIFRKKNDV